jgi:TatD DNase family protein
MVFIDVHCHLEMCKSDAAKIVGRARTAGVGIIINNSVNKNSNRKTLELASKFPEVKAALGYYPSEVINLSEGEFEDELAFIRKNKDKVVALGEVGLDLKENQDLEKQKMRFQKFIELSLEMDISLIVHSRKAELECIEILERMKAKKVIMHCFSGDFNLIKRIVENNWFLSIPANVAFSEHFQKIVGEVPIENLFCETDSPYLHPIRGKYDNEPANVVESYKKIAEIKGISLEECEKAIEENYKRVFGVIET